MNILILKTFPLSLTDWYRTGMISRELKIYHTIEKINKNINFKLLSYGSIEDLKYKNYLKKIKLSLPFQRIYFSNIVIKFFYSFLIPIINKRDFIECDIIQTNQFRGCWVGIIASFIYNKPLIIRMGFEYYNFQKKNKKNIVYLFFLKKFSKFAYHFSQSIIVTTKDMQIFISKNYDINIKKINIIPNYIDTNLFKKNNEIKQNSKLLFVGRINPQKNLHNLFLAIKDLDLELDVIGHGERKDYINLAKNLNIRVNFIDNMRNDKLPIYYNACNIYILCSHYEGNPKTLLEAMACECSIVCANSEGISNLVDNNSAVLVNTDFASIREGINLLINNHKLQHKLSKNARQLVLKNNTLNLVSNTLLKIYENIL